MFMNKRKAAGVALLVFGTGAAVMAYQVTQGSGTDASKVARATSTASADVTDWVAGWPSLTSSIETPKTKAILEALERPVPLHFPEATPLGDVVRYIR
jgi:hypothetical protein